jgi:hypothetical protein
MFAGWVLPLNLSNNQVLVSFFLFVLVAWYGFKAAPAGNLVKQKK